MKISPPPPSDFILHPMSEANRSAGKVALVVKWHPVRPVNQHKQGWVDMWQPSDSLSLSFSFFETKTQTKNK